MCSSQPPFGSDPETLCALVGPTAAGKTELSLALAEGAGAEIVSLDSMLVYRGLDIGTAKPSAAERARVHHHLIDRVDADERYDVTRYLAEVSEVLAEIRARGRRALFVGGTGFYLRALTHGIFGGPEVEPALRAELEERAARLGPEALHAELAAVDPEAAERLHPNDVRRVVRGLEVWRQTGRALSDWQREWRGRPGRPRRVVGLRPDPEELERRIRERTRAMLDAGWVQEAVRVREGVGFGPTAAAALGYREVLRLADGELDRGAAEAEIALRTRQFARRQGTWFRKFPEIRWIAPPREGDRNDLERALAEARSALGW